MGDYKSLKDYNGITFNVENEFGSIILTNSLYSDSGSVQHRIKAHGKVPEKLICYVGSDGFYRIYETEKVYIDTFNPNKGKKKIAHETNSVFLSEKDLKEGHVSIVEMTEDGNGYSLIGEYYINLQTGAESAIPFENSGKQRQ